MLNDAGVRYLIAGSYAAMKYTEPVWSTIDVWIEPSDDNSQKVLEALRRFGAPLAELSAGDLVDPATIFQIGVSGNRIDLLTSIAGLTFTDAWARRDTFQFGDLSCPVLSLDDTIRAAEAANRPEDRRRVRAL